MTFIQRFWSPCIVYTDLKKACFAIAVYTIAASMVLLTLTKYMMNGGESTELYFPFFENDVRNTLVFYGNLAILFDILMIIASCSLIHGVIVSLRGFMLPWLFGMMFIILFQLVWSIWLLYGYYIYIQIVIPVIVYWLWAAYNFYFLVIFILISFQNYVGCCFLGVQQASQPIISKYNLLVAYVYLVMKPVREKAFIELREKKIKIAVLLLVMCIHAVQTHCMDAVAKY